MSKQSTRPKGRPPQFLQELRALANEQHITPMVIRQRAGISYSQAWRVLKSRQARCLSWDAVAALSKALRVSIVFQLPVTQPDTMPDVVARVSP